MLSEKVAKIGFSSTLKINSRARSMRAEGIDVVDLSVGEPDFATPDAIKAAGSKAIEDNFTTYTPAAGIAELKDAIAHRLYEDHGLDYRREEIIVTPGAKAGIYFCAIALFDPGDECLIPSPYWVSYPEIAGLADAVPVVIATEEASGFKVTPEKLRAAVTGKSKALMLNNPCNPTGAVYSREELEALAEVVIDSGIYVIADEIYDKVIFDEAKFTSLASLGEEIRKRTIVVNGVSKAYAMTGWRIGFAAGPEEIVLGMSKVQSHATTHACSISQRAAVEALDGSQTAVQRMAVEFQQRRDFLMGKLRQIGEITCNEPQGAFYAFPNVSAFFDREAGGIEVRDAFSLAHYLLEKAHVAVVPGEAFGMPGHIRISYAGSMENLETGMERFVEAMSGLRAAPRENNSVIDNRSTTIKGDLSSETNENPRPENGRGKR